MSGSNGATRPSARKLSKRSRMDGSAGSGWTWLAAILFLEVVLGLLGELMPEAVKSAFDALAGHLGMSPTLLWIVLIVGTAIPLLVLRQCDGRNTGADKSTLRSHASRIASQFGLAAAAFLLLMLLVHLLPLQKVVQQNHSGSGDNVGRDKVVNVNNFLLGSADYRKLEEERTTERLDAAAEISRVEKQMGDLRKAA